MPSMTTPFKLYTLCWIAACSVAVFLFVQNWCSYALAKEEYWKFIVKPWRLITFIIAAMGMTLIAPYSGDYTWDYFNGFYMSVLAYLTAPWSIGAIYKVIKRQLPLSQGYVAFCLWMFSASWSYDIYLVFRDGSYPITWFSNIFASSVLYIAAGLFWSLDWLEGRGATFAFLEDNWPYANPYSGFMRILLYLIPFMALVSFLILYFFWFQVGVSN